MSAIFNTLLAGLSINVSLSFGDNAEEARNPCGIRDDAAARQPTLAKTEKPHAMSMRLLD